MAADVERKSRRDRRTDRTHSPRRRQVAEFRRELLAEPRQAPQEPLERSLEPDAPPFLAPERAAVPLDRHGNNRCSRGVGVMHL